MTKKVAKFNFEESLTNLENLVEAMEAGDLSLEEALKAFEQGIKLTRECQQALEQAEQKVQVLLAQTGEPTATAFAVGDEATRNSASSDDDSDDEEE
jgi:exodeoxyribonuclease VII small subunit